MTASTIVSILIFLLLSIAVPSSCQKVEIHLNPDGTSGGDRPAPSLPELISSVKPGPTATSDTPVMETQEELLMRQLKEALPTMNLNLNSKERDFQQMLMNQLKADDEATARARKIPRPRGLINITAYELGKHDGRHEDLPIYTSIKRRLYDVTDGIRYYGPHGKYRYLVGREVGRALATGCFESTGLTYDVRGLSQAGLDTIEGWQQFYAKKYRFAGYLKGRKVDPDSPIPDDDCPEAEKYGGRPQV